MSSISILIPTYNRSLLIREVINSVLPLIDSMKVEIIIGDNSDNEETENVLKEIIESYSEITYYRHQRNLGMVCNWGFLINKARMDYCLILSDDDILLNPSLIEVAVSAMTKFDWSIYIFNSKLFTHPSDLNDYQDSFTNFSEPLELKTAESIVSDWVYNKFPIYPCSIITSTQELKNSLQRESNLPIIDIILAIDVALYLPILLSNSDKLNPIDKRILSGYRVHESIGKKNNSKIKWAADYKNFASYIEEKINLKPHEVHNISRIFREAEAFTRLSSIVREKKLQQLTKTKLIRAFSFFLKYKKAK